MELGAARDINALPPPPAYLLETVPGAPRVRKEVLSWRLAMDQRQRADADPEATASTTDPPASPPVAKPAQTAACCGVRSPLLLWSVR